MNDPDQLFSWGVSPSIARDVRSRPDLFGELEESVTHTVRCGPAVNAGLSVRERARSALWNDVLRPLGVHSYIGFVLDSPTRPRQLLAVHRMTRLQPFRTADVHAQRSVLSIMAIGDELCARRERDATSLVLTRREREIAELVERGLTNAEIARVLGISRNTVRNHLAAAFERTGVANRAELAARARR